MSGNLTANPSGGPIIGLNKIRKSFGSGGNRVDVLNGIDLSIGRGEFVAIMGPSGSGKSTLLNILGCLDVPTSGTYHLAGTNVTAADVRLRAQFRNRRIGFVFQNANLLPRATALENVELPLVYRGVSARRRRELAIAALASVDLLVRRDHLPSRLSGGEQQRVALARAIVTQPDLLLADEPTGALDSDTGDSIMSLIAGLHRAGRTIVLVTHDAERAEYAGRLIRLRDGRISGDARTRASEFRLDPHQAERP